MGILLFISSSSSYLVLFKCRRSRDSQLRIARLADEDQSRYDVTVHAREHGKCGIGVHLHSKSTIDRCLWLAILQGEKSSNTPLNQEQKLRTEIHNQQIIYALSPSTNSETPIRPLLSPSIYWVSSDNLSIGWLEDILLGILCERHTELKQLGDDS